LHVSAKNNAENKNNKDDLRKIEVKIYEYLKNLEFVPSM
jgi:hypothetical protein